MRVLRRLSRVALFTALAAAPFVGVSAGAAELGDRARAAEALLSENKPIQALAEMEAAFNIAWERAPLGFSEALFVAARPAGFGIYDARPTNVFREGEDMLVYAEPFGFGYGRDNELFLIDFKADFELRTPTDQILHRQADFADLTMKSRRRNKEFQVFITYNFNGLKPGDYVLVTRLHDLHSSKTGAFDLPFTIAAPMPPPAPGAAGTAPAGTGDAEPGLDADPVPDEDASPPAAPPAN